MNRRLPTFGLCTLLLLTPALAQAEERLEQASPELVENALKGLDIAYEKGGNNSYGFALQDRYLLLSRSKDGSRLLLKAPHQGAVTLEVLNRYNEARAVTTRAVLTSQGSAVLEAALDCRLGIQEEMVRKFLTNFVADVNDFEGYLAKQPTGIPKFVRSAKVTRVAPPLTALSADQKSFEIGFPAGAPAETAWKIEWDMQTGSDANLEGFKFGKGRSSSTLLFKIKKAYYRPSSQSPWVQVLEDAHPQEFYVPYLGFKGTYFFDLANVGQYESLREREGGVCSQILGKERFVMAELRDRGVVFKHHDRSRRGEGLALWANFVAGNYTYLVEFVFNDDGSINFRHAPTGYNYFDHFDKAAHMHNCLWRIGVKLRIADEVADRPTPNAVRIAQLKYDGTKDGQLGELDFTDVNQEQEVDWDPKRYTTLRVTNPDKFLLPDDAKRPDRKLPISYDLVPLQQGQPRHLRDHEKFSEHDFYVTRPDSDAKMYIHMHEYFKDPLKRRSLEGADGVVLWHMSSALHVPRGEDGIYRGNNVSNGQALATWTNLELRPRNLLASTPLYNVKP